MSLFDTVRLHVQQEDAFVIATVIAGPEKVGAKALISSDGSVEGEPGSVELRQRVQTAAGELLACGVSETRRYELSDGVYEVFLDCFIPPPKIVVVGAVQTAQVLSRLAKELGYRVIVTDARAAFATRERFPEADEVLKGWPQDVLPGIRFDDATYVVLLSHDPKFDEPTLKHVLPLPVRYVGAIGSRRTQQQRRDRLRDEGFDEETLQKLHGPVGLDLGGRSAEETALAILAEITAVRHGRAGGMMSRKVPTGPAT